ncbi:AAA family ATPase [Nakamurella endophytica]|uniref:Orc1-like AAA ATPase domain-containing protein n=1 Tax=Nakamurella endophytica TaxID=1748367 RepID=A0A917SP52_9ACTN|nr:AAA family ATPase [Nakamurella endophytica]GGL89417.1 hypothetical protein GCM10011594_06280 [Nakamurella endophytica]
MENSPYTPGAGTVPPVLAGRDAMLHRLALGLNDAAVVGRIRAQDLLLLGPRGVGKTVALTTYGRRAAAGGFEVVGLQAVSGQGGLVESLLQWADRRAAEHSGPWRRARASFDRIASVSLGAAGVSVGVVTREEHRPVTVGAHTLAAALADLAGQVRRDAPQGGVLLTLDEVQVAAAGDLALLAAALHRLNVDHPQAPVVFAGTGLPHTLEVLRVAGVTHPDRLFNLEALPVALAEADAVYAVVEPGRRLGVNWHPDAAAAVVRASGAYPAHLQQLAHVVWTAATGPHLVTAADVRRAMPHFEADLARRTLGPRFDRMADRQLEYLAALAVHGGRASTAVLAATLRRTPQELSWIRQELLREGDIHAPHRGRVEMTMPIAAPYLLTRYEQARGDADTPLLSLAELRRNAAAVPPRPLPGPAGGAAD